MASLPPTDDAVYLGDFLIAIRDNLERIAVALEQRNQSPEPTPGFISREEWERAGDPEASEEDEVGKEMVSAQLWDCLQELAKSDKKVSDKDRKFIESFISRGRGCPMSSHQEVIVRRILHRHGYLEDKEE